MHVTDFDFFFYFISFPEQHKFSLYFPRTEFFPLTNAPHSKLLRPISCTQTTKNQWEISFW